MKKKPSLFLFLFTLLSLTLSSQDQIILGRDDNWENSFLNNIILKRGWEGHIDLNVLGSVYEAGPETDLLLPFDNSRTLDETGRYMLLSQADLTEYEYRRGRSSAVLREGSPLLIEPGRDSLFSGNREWGDFTLEFQLYPALLQEGEILFHWKGLYRQNEELIPQEITCRVSRRSLVWTFKNFFVDNEERESSFVLTGESLVPREWNHHMVRYDSELGLLEYLVDGVPSAVTYTTPSGREESHIFQPRINQREATPITLGSDFTGFIDEVRLESRFVDFPQLDDFDKRGVYLSSLVDLKYQKSFLESIETVDKSPGDSSLYYYYAFSDRKEEMDKLRRDFSRGDFSFGEDKWHPFTPDEEFDHVRGRYLLIGAYLYPDLGVDQSPSISEIRIKYQPELPPVPPLNIKISSEDGEISISWDYWKDHGMGGFLIYYGDRPGYYFGDSSPLIVEPEARSYNIKGLELHRRWYFSIVAFSDSDPAQYSQFSREVSIRP